jgi:hypothetical protein
MYRQVDQVDLELLDDIYSDGILQDGSLIKNFLLECAMIQFAELAAEYLALIRSPATIMNSLSAECIARVAESSIEEEQEEIIVQELMSFNSIQIIKTALYAGWSMTRAPSEINPEDFWDILTMQLSDYDPSCIDTLVIGCNTMTSEQALICYNFVCDKKHSEVKGLSLTLDGRVPGIMFFDMYNELHWQRLEKWGDGKKFHIINHSYLSLGCASKFIKEVIQRMAFSHIDDNGCIIEVDQLFGIEEEDVQGVTDYSDILPIEGDLTFSLVELCKASVNSTSPMLQEGDEPEITGASFDDVTFPS